MAKLAKNKEFERKFWVLKDRLSKMHLAHAARTLEIEQGYVSISPIQVRLRIVDGLEAVMEIKGPDDEEFGPYPIPHDEARAMLAGLRIGDLIRKARHEFPAGFGGLKWEVDVFKAANSPLVIAEIETPAKDTPLDRSRFPAWIGDEITGDPLFGPLLKNKNLVLKPFSTWSKKLQAQAERKMRQAPSR